MSEFDQYAENYKEKINESIGFSGRDQDFFTGLKADAIFGAVQEKLCGGPKSLLDIGCGTGAIHAHLKPCFDKITGVDVSESSIEIARETNPGNQFVHYDGVHLPFPDETFDVASAICVLHHVPPAGRANFFMETYRILKRGGLAIVIEHNPFNPLTQFVVSRCEFDDDAILVGSRECRALMNDAGLEATSVKFIAVFPFEFSVLRRIEKFIEPIPLGAQFIASGIRGS